MKTKTQKFLTLILVIAVAFVGNAFLLLKGLEKNVVLAEFTTETISVDNSTFNQNSPEFPASPNNWTTVGTDTVSTKGVISVKGADYDKYSKEYGLSSFRPTKFSADFDDYMLLINSGNVSSKFGYKSSDLTLKSNSFYEISAYVQTKSGSTASIVLSGTKFDDLTNTKMFNVSTNGGWALYTFYVETSSIENASVNLELWLGSSTSASTGYVLFDNVEVKNITHSTYYTAKNLAIAQNKFVSLKSVAQSEENFESYSIDNNDLLYGSKNAPQSEINASIANITTDNANMFNNTKALQLKATTSGAIGLNYSDFSIERFGLYRVSIMAKTNLTTGNANIVLKSNNPYGQSNTTYKPETKTLNVNTSNLTNNTFNNWIEFAFYITGDVYFDRTINLELWVGSESENAVGTVLFDNLKIEKINSADYATGNSNSNTAELILNTFSTTPSLSNDFFNYVSLENGTVSYPLTPTNWTHFSKNETGYSFGVITSTTSVLGETTPNNILKLENTNANYQYVKSIDASITASTSESASYSKFVIFAKTENVNNVGASIILKSGDNTIAQFTNITNNTWQKFEFHIKNGISAQTFNIYLQLGNEISNITGSAYFDDVSYKTTDETTFNNAKDSTSTFVKTLDFSKENFEITTGEKNGYLYNSPLWTADAIQNGITAGVLNTTDFNSGLGISNPDSATPNTHKNVLMIKSNQDVYYSFTSTLNTTLTKDNYYKISVWVKTANISATTTTDDNGKELKIGASLSITGLNEKFVGINTYDSGTLENAWEEFVFYIKATTDTSAKIVLSLGNSDASAKGEVYFDDITVSSITESVYTTSTENIENNANILAIGSTETSEEKEENNNSTGTNFDWVLIPTLLTALALIFAVVSYSIRKSKLAKSLAKKRKNKKTNAVKVASFDRTKTLNKNKSTEKGKVKLQNLTAEKEKIEKEIKENQLRFDAFLTESNNEENNKNITHEQIQKYIDENAQIDFDYEFDFNNQKLKQENELLFNRTFFEVNNQNLIDAKNELESEIKKLQK